MSIALQFILPLVTAFALLGIFHLVAYLHIQLSEADQIEPEDDFGELSHF